MNISEYENNLISNIIKSIEKHGGKKLLSSIILTGSFGRKEPTYSIKENGLFFLKSDIEIALICQKNIYRKQINQLIKNVSAEFNEDLNLMQLSEKRVKKAYNFNYSIFIPKYKTLFTYDLFNGSYTIWGKDFLKNSNVTLESIDLYEAKRIVANRIGELEFLSETNNDYAVQQWKCKLLLAIVTSWLILNKQYVSSYYGQYEQAYININSLINIFGEDFWKDYNGAFQFLRKNGDEYIIKENNLRRYVMKISKLFEENNLKVSKVNSLSRKIKYIFKYIKSTKKFNIYNLEDRILQGLIDYYQTNDNLKIKKIAKMWHEILY